MGLKLSSAIAIARGVLNDRRATTRYSDSDLLEYGNGALRSLAEIKPEWLLATIDHTCAAGASQELPVSVHTIVEVVRIKNGNAVTVTDRAALDAFSPGWMAEASGAAVHWMPDGMRRFYVYPPAVDTQVLEVKVVDVPGPYTADEDTGLPETITEAVADYMVGMAESRDDEHVVSQRSAQFMAQFAARISAKPKE